MKYLIILLLQIIIKFSLCGYRCPNCFDNNSMDSEKIHDGRLLFICKKCEICSIIPFFTNLDEAYIEFLEKYDKGTTIKKNELNSLLSTEKIIRSKSEIDTIIKQNRINENDRYVKDIIYSQEDFIVDTKILSGSKITFGNALSDLPIDENLLDLLNKKGISKLYQFQEDVIKKILLGRDILIISPTASGKTEAFSIPIIQKIKEDLDHQNKTKRYRCYALFVYPTKALSRDQFKKIEEFANSVNVRIGIFDGDADNKSKEDFYFQPPEIVITNFDVIHFHLINNTRFAELLSEIKYLVVDEVHVYTGVFGSNVHYIVKRLERKLKNKNNRLQIIASSATLPNYDSFSKTLFSRNMDFVISSNKIGKIIFLMIFPVLHSQKTLILKLLKKSVKNDHKTLIFSNSHLSAELIAYYGNNKGLNIKVHRSGLLPNIRKSIEDSFHQGKIMAISATPTLELGIDIGDVDTVISNIVPVNRLLQRLGRAGRKGQTGYAILALGNDPISQYYKIHPNDYYNDEEIPYLDPSNIFVQENQILAMISDRELLLNESKKYEVVIKQLINKNLIILKDNKYVLTTQSRKILNKLNIRGIGEKIDIFLNNKKIGERNLPHGLDELHQNAIYFIGGKRYLVNDLTIDMKNNSYFANVKPISSRYPYYTKSITEEEPIILETYDERYCFNMNVRYCSFLIKKKIIGYSNIELGKEVSQGQKIFLDKSVNYEYITKGIIFRVPIPLDTIENEVNEDFVKASGYHATEHVMIEGSSMITGGSSQDLGGIALGTSGLIVIHDGSIGGNGASKTLFDRLEKCLERSYKIISECPCSREDGCPKCTYSYRCGNNNEYLHKKSAREILSRIINKERSELIDIENFGRNLI